MSQRPSDMLSLKRETTVLFTSSEAEIHMAIRSVEYDGILRRVGKIGNPVPSAINWATTAAGGALGTAVAATVLMATKATLKAWIIPVLWVIVGFALVFALFAWRVHLRLETRRGDDVKDLCADMERMKSYFPTLEMPPTPRPGTGRPAAE